ncbi:MAG: dnaJ3 [Deltaproteobacteria bacterium]|nr:dnaJ3 [Deltaproteobacteria bacterium]
MDRNDYYEILEINRGASAKEIKEAYRRLAFQCHPDRNPGDAAAALRMKGINEAYAVLSDTVKRAQYDNLRDAYGNSAYDRFRQDHSENDIFRDSDINQIFEEFSRSFGFRNFEDIFKEAYGPGYQSFQFRQGNVFGRGFVFTGRMNRGAFSPGARRRVFSGLLGKLAGYALKKITGIGIQQDIDRYDVLKLRPEQAKKGGKIPYTDKKDSRSVLISVPPGITQGKIIRLRGLGPGDLYLKVEITKPLLKTITDLFKLK